MAELTGLPSPRINWSATDLPQALRKFKATGELYFSGPLKEKSEGEKISYLLIWTGDEGIELVSTWSLTETESTKLDTYWTKFEECVVPKSNFRLARYKLRVLKQDKGESVDCFIKKVRILFKECKYTNVDEHVIDAPIFGSSDPRVQAKLLKHDASLTLTAEAATSQLSTTELSFFGHTIGAAGLKPDPQKVQAIRNMDPSTSRADLQTFLGMVQYLGRYIPNLASVSAVLWDLTKGVNEFQWNPEHQQAADKVKELIASLGSLQYFDGNKPVTIQVDLSMCGLGATLLQRKGPVEYRSKLLSETERRYSNIEREMLSIVYGLEKFHYYAYGRHVTIETDHKPLESIFKKHLSSAPPRIARMMLRIQKYDVDIKYVLGKEIPLADALSRLNPCNGDTIKGLDVSINELHMHLNASPTRVEQIQMETAKNRFKP